MTHAIFTQFYFVKQDENDQIRTCLHPKNITFMNLQCTISHSFFLRKKANNFEIAIVLLINDAHKTTKLDLKDNRYCY